jgi:nucleotide-binding universal stress UspA family protein
LADPRVDGLDPPQYFRLILSNAPQAPVWPLPAMSYAAILVHAGVDAACEARLRLAADIANQFEAALIGLGAEIFDPPTAAAAMGYVDGETMVAEAEVLQEDLKLAEARFLKIAKDVRGGAEWRSGVGMPADMVVRQSRAADLIVAGRRRPEPWSLHNCAGPGDLLMDSGRPVLVAPPNQASLDASSVLVAWKDTREARRAVADALPFLYRATRVVVAEVCEHPGDTDAEARLSDVAQYLERHGINASTSVRATGGAAAHHALLQIADAHGAGLIVAGGYGHSRLREWVFGGVTEALLTACDRAVLLSH